MAAVTICSNFGAQENKICHCFHFSPIYLPWSDRPGCHDLSFLNVEFWASCSLSSLAFIKRLFSSSSLSAIRVVSSAYLRLLIFSWQSWFQLMLHPVWFHIMYSPYKLNKQDDNIQPLRTPFPILNQSIDQCPILNVISWRAYRFLRRQVMRYSHL